MNRPERQRNRLIEKVAVKESRSHKKPGTRTKRWRKWINLHKPADAAATAAT